MRNLKKIFTSILIVIILLFSINEVLADELENPETNITIQEELDSTKLNSYVTSDEICFLDDNIVSIKGSFTEYLNVNDILNKINISKLYKDYSDYDIDVYVANANDINKKLANDSKVFSNMKLVLSFNDIVDNTVQKIIYNISVYGDINSDGIVNEIDVDTMIHNILTNNNDKYNILNVTSLMYAIRNKSWDTNIDDNDIVLNDNIYSNKDIHIGDEVIVNYIIKGFKQNNINGIEGILEYDNKILELKEVLVNGTNEKIGVDNRFLYILDGYNAETVITFKFKAFGIGITTVKLNNLLASIDGKEAKLSTTKTIDIEVKKYSEIGGDVDPDNSDQDSSKQNNSNQNTSDGYSKNPVTLSNNITNNNDSNYKPLVYSDISKTTVSQIALSNDNYIKELKIKNYDIDFDMYKYEYSLTVDSKTKSLDLDIILNDKDASYEVLGNENFKIGENTVSIIVTALDGSTKTYTITINKEESNDVKEEKDNQDNKKNDSSRIVIIILIILVIIGLIYIIFKDDEEEEVNK